MELQNAIKKVEGEGYKIEQVSSGLYRSIIGENKDRVLEFYGNGGSGTITCIGVRSIHDQSDPQSDYCAFSFYRNLTQALRSNVQ
jgi:hypothetical protein